MKKAFLMLFFLGGLVNGQAQTASQRIASVWDYFYIKHPTVDSVIPSPICEKLFVLSDSNFITGHLTTYGRLPKFKDKTLRPILKGFYWEGGKQGQTHLFPLEKVVSANTPSGASSAVIAAQKECRQAWFRLVDARSGTRAALNPLVDSMLFCSEFSYLGAYWLETDWFDESQQQRLASKLFLQAGSIVRLESVSWEACSFRHWLLKQFGDYAIQRTVLEWEKTNLKKATGGLQKPFIAFQKILPIGKTISIKGLRLYFSNAKKINDDQYFVQIQAHENKNLVFKNLYLTKDSYFCYHNLCVQLTDIILSERGQLSLRLWIIPTPQKL